MQVFDSLLDSSQLAAWQQLQQARYIHAHVLVLLFPFPLSFIQSPQDTTLRGSTELLSNVERYGKYLALFRNETTLKRRSNIGWYSIQSFYMSNDPFVH